MPQKRNPDMAELVRGRTGRAIGNWTAFARRYNGPGQVEYYARKLEKAHANMLRMA